MNQQLVSRGDIVRGITRLVFCFAVLLPGTILRAQTAAQMASQGLAWFSPFLTNGQVGGGEDVRRFWFSNDGGGAMWWHDANTVEMLADYTAATGDRTYVSNLQAYKDYNGIFYFGRNSTFLGLHPDHLGGENNANDDKLWWALAMIRIYDVLNDPTYLHNAENIFADVCTSWQATGIMPVGGGAILPPNNNPACGGGVTWTDDGHYLNAITNELFFQTATKLMLRDPNHQACQLTGLRGFEQIVPVVVSPGGLYIRWWPNTYAGWAAAEWEWFKEYWFFDSGNPKAFGAEWPPTFDLVPIQDGLGDDCKPGDSGHNAVWTYNQGPILGALVDLSNAPQIGGEVADLPNLNNAPQPIVTDTPAVLTQFAFQIASVAMQQLTQPVNGQPILTERNDDGTATACEQDSAANCQEFKGVFMRYLGRLLASTNPTISYCTDGWNTPFAPLALTFLNNNANQIWTMGNAQGGVFPEKWSIKSPEFPPSEGMKFRAEFEAAPAWYQPAQTSALDAIIADIQPVTVTKCGARGAPCCATGCVCGNGLVCNNKTCVPCGGFQQPCCHEGLGCAVPALSCKGGTCTCTATGQACSANSDCCSGACLEGKCYCAPVGEHCFSNGDCCSGVCTNGTCACRALTESCSSSAVCCGGNECVKGVCTLYKPPPTCNGVRLPATLPCTAAWHCCGKDGWKCGLCQ